MKRRRTIALGLSFLAVVAALGVAYVAAGDRLVASDPDTLATTRPALAAFGAWRGQAVYRRHCASCHAGPAEGVANLADADWLYGEGKVSEIERIVAYGIRAQHPLSWNLAEMPAYGRPRPAASEPSIQPLSPGDIRDVVEYLTSLQDRPADGPAVIRGAAIYAGRGGCYDCHSPDARGDAAIGAPDLTDRVQLFGDGGRAALTRAVTLGHKGVSPAFIHRLTPRQIREVSLYVHSLSRPEAR